MVIALHRSTLAIFHGRRLLHHRDEWSFAPSIYSSQRSATGFLHVRHTSSPIQVQVPVGSQIVERNGVDRLAVYFDAFGLEATSVAYLASQKLFGFRWDEWPGPGHMPALPDHEAPHAEPAEAFEPSERARGGRRAGSPGP